MDEVRRGETPATVDGLPAGDVVLVHVIREGFKPSWRNVTVPASGEERIVFDLVPKLGYITLETRPEGAQALLDGTTDLGKTPVRKHPIPVGQHTYQLSYPDHQVVEKAIQVEEGVPYTFHHTLLPKNARLRVIARPSGASVFLNDQLQDKVTPATFDLLPGTYVVGVRAQGYAPAEDTVTLAANEDKSITLAMSAGYVPEGMVLVPSGEFLMGVVQGAPDEQPQRKVFVDSFYIDRTEVTNRQYKRVVPTHTYPVEKDDFPVTGVTWEEANFFAQVVGKRLPTEAEWEKAARGDEGIEYPWGNRFDPQLSNTSDKVTVGSEPVGSYRAGASPYGCLDMAGNAYEWTSTWYSAYPGNSEIQKDYGQVYRVLRGGSYMTDQFAARCARRHYDRPVSRRADYGFRCALSAAREPTNRN